MLLGLQVTEILVEYLPKDNGLGNGHVACNYWRYHAILLISRPPNQNRGTGEPHMSTSSNNCNGSGTGKAGKTKEMAQNRLLGTVVVKVLYVKELLVGKLKVQDLVCERAVGGRVVCERSCV